MKRWLLTCLSSVALTGTALGDGPAAEPDPAAMRRELRELRQTAEELNARIKALEERLSRLEAREPKRHPWQREQPFYWDGRWRPSGSEPVFREDLLRRELDFRPESQRP